MRGLLCWEVECSRKRFESCLGEFGGRGWNCQNFGYFEGGDNVGGFENGGLN